NYTTRSRRASRVGPALTTRAEDEDESPWSTANLEYSHFDEWLELAVTGYSTRDTRGVECATIGLPWHPACWVASEAPA
ncbi:hypothetical protein EAH_00032040, partial [Eimeria acervulina]